MAIFDDLPEFPGIEVYDRETGEPLTAKDIFPSCNYNDWLVSDTEGLLILPYYPEYTDHSCYEIPQNDKYIVRVGNVVYRW